jgi:LPXTG-motif cell wall-anchored protein
MGPRYSKTADVEKYGRLSINWTHSQRRSTRSTGRFAELDLVRSSRRTPVGHMGGESTMRVSMLGRVAVAVGAAVVVGLVTASPASANSTVAINPGNVPTTASAYGTHECDKNFGGGPFPDKDVWVFVLPGKQDKVGDFVSVTAKFGTNGTLTIPADGGAIVTGKGTSKAWITTPAGWTLTDASATITGSADKFNLTHTCPAGGGEKSKENTSEGSESEKSHDTTSGSVVSGVAGGEAGSASGGLPVTGTAVTSMAVVGAALVAGGIALLAMRRRRDALVFSAEGEAPAEGDDKV